MHSDREPDHFADTPQATIVGIDIGATGALSFLSASNAILDIADMPILRDGTNSRPTVNGPLLATILRKHHPVHAHIETVEARPNEGPAGAFSFGRSRGIIEGVLANLEIPYTFTSPPAWKRAVGIPPGRSAAKDAARSEAIRRWPEQASLFARIKDHGRADSALIAAAGLQSPTITAWMATCLTSASPVAGRTPAQTDDLQSEADAVGIKIGPTSGISFLSADGQLLDAIKLPLVETHGPKIEIDIARLQTLLQAWRPKCAFVEFVAAFPGQDPSVAFSYGRCRGVLEGLFAVWGTPCELITPLKWRRSVGLPPVKNQAEHASLHAAIQQWPTKVDRFTQSDSRAIAESAFIALSGLRNVTPKTAPRRRKPVKALLSCASALLRPPADQPSIPSAKQFSFSF